MALPTERPLSALLDEERPDEAELIARYIHPHPHKSGRAYARVRDTDQSVGAMIRHLQEDGDISGTAAAYGVPEEAIWAAIAFYRRNRAILDARFLLEEDQWDPDFRRGG